MMDYKSMATPMESNLKKLRKSALDSDLVDPMIYRELIWSLMYLVNPRPDICYVVVILSQCMKVRRQVHWVAGKHVLRYLRGTVGHGLRYSLSGDMRLEGYSNSDWARRLVNRRSTFGCCFSLGSAMISYCSRKQTFVAPSTTKVEYIAVNLAAREVVWLRKLLLGLFGRMLEPTMIHCDNQSSMKLSENPVFHDRSKHV